MAFFDEATGHFARLKTTAIYVHTNRPITMTFIHMNKSSQFKKGDAVMTGDVIGLVGNTGNVLPKPTSENDKSGTHLHFGVIVRPDIGGNTCYKKRYKCMNGQWIWHNRIKFTGDLNKLEYEREDGVMFYGVEQEAQ